MLTCVYSLRLAGTALSKLQLTGPPCLSLAFAHQDFASRLTGSTHDGPVMPWCNLSSSCNPAVTIPKALIPLAAELKRHATAVQEQTSLEASDQSYC